MALKNTKTAAASTARVGKGRRVAIPKSLCKDLGLREGDLVEVQEARGRGAVLITPKARVEPDEVLTPQEAKVVAKGEAELRRGEYVTLSRLHHDLDRPVVQKRRKTA